MSRKEEQHFVPRLYLKQFAQDGMVSINNIESGQYLPSVPYKTQCKKHLLYGADKVWEDRFEEFEKLWSRAIRAAGAQTSISELHKELLKQFMLYQHGRAASSIANLKSNLIETTIHAQWLRFPDECRAKTAEEIETECKSLVEENFSNSQHMDIFLENDSSVSDLSVLIIEYQTLSELVISDNPIIVINPYDWKSHGFIAMGFMSFYPVNPHRLVVVYDSKMYPDFRADTYITSNDEDEVATLNSYQCINCDRLIYASPNLDRISLSESLREIRRKERQTSEVSRVRTQFGQSIMMSNGITSLFRANISFGRVCHRFNRITEICRDPLSRHWSSDVEYKLDRLCKDNKPPMPPEAYLTAVIDVSPKELRRGFQMLRRAAHWYWGK